MTLTAASEQVVIYTDGSCHSQSRAGAWVAILLMGMDKIVLSGQEADTTHNRMELVAVINALTYLKTSHSGIRKLRSEYPCPWAWDGIFTGMPSREVKRSVP